MYLVQAAVLHCGVIAGKGTGARPCEGLVVKLMVLRVPHQQSEQGSPEKHLMGHELLGVKFRGLDSLHSPAASCPLETCFALLD